MSSRAFRNNNPGNIRHHGPSGNIYPVAERWLATDDGENYARFPSIPAGCAALVDLIATVYKDMTVTAMIQKYAPSDDNNDPGKYVLQICSWAVIQPLTMIRDLPPAKFFDLCKAISRFEGWIA
jgi:hypothetical protein